MFQHTLLCLALISVISHPFATAHGSHSHRSRRYLKEWSQPQEHPVNKLFKRGGDGNTYPDVGSADWQTRFPPANGKTPDQSLTPKEWLDALNAAVASGKIPQVDLTTVPRNSAGDPTGSPVYPNKQDPTGPGICSSTYKCRGQGDIWDAPDNNFAISFDDGPLPPTTELVGFLKQNNEIATHFMIGANIRNNPQQFLDVFNYGGDCAVHTWSHPYMTSLSNEAILAELGWTMQIIHDSTGGKVPRLWRPPTGDSDIRVRAIAKEVFGLTTVIWNQDSEDWRISVGQQTLDGVNADMDKWLTGPKSPGLIVLEHELTNITVQGFTGNYPKIKSNGWNTKSLAQLFGDVYQNVQGDQVTSANIYLPPSGDAPVNTTSSVSSSTSSTQSTTSSGSPVDRATVIQTVTGTSSGSSSTGTSASSNKTNSALPSTTTFSLWFAFVMFVSSMISLS